MREVTFITTHHPSGVMQNRTKNLHPWLRDTWKIGRILGGKKVDPKPTLVVADSKEEFEEATKGWRHFAFDLETDRHNRYVVYLASVSDGKTAVAIDPQRGGDVRWMQTLFDRSGFQIVQNGVFDVPILQHHGLVFDLSKLFDTMIAGYTLHPDEWASLGYLASMNLDVFAWKNEDESDFLGYNACDSAYTYRIAMKQWQELARRKMDKFFTELMMPVLVEIIMDLNKTGVCVDDDKRSARHVELTKKEMAWRRRAEQHFKSLTKVVGSKSTLTAPVGDKGGLSYAQTVQLLYKTLKLPMRLDPKSGSPSTSADTLKSLRSHDKKRCQGCSGSKILEGALPLTCEGTVNLLLEKSKLGESRTHLIQLQPQAGLKRVFTRFVFGGDEKHEEMTGRSSATGARTGRLSSRAPNLMNMTWTVRDVIVPTAGQWLVERDFSQIELKINAWGSRDKSLLRAISAGDAHLYIAWLCDHEHGLWDISKYSWEECLARFNDGDPHVRKGRNSQKTPTYGWFYRMGALKMVFHYDIDYHRAQSVITGLNRAFPGVVSWWSLLVEKASVQHYLVNPFGRRREFWDIKEEVTKICNFPAQSTAADILFKALLGIVRDPVYRRMKARGEGQLILTVHDSALGEAKNPALLNGILKKHMDKPWVVGLPIASDGSMGKNWRPEKNKDTGVKDNPGGMVPYEKLEEAA